MTQVKKVGLIKSGREPIVRSTLWAICLLVRDPFSDARLKTLPFSIATHHSESDGYFGARVVTEPDGMGLPGES